MDICSLQKHGDNDWSLWQTQVPAGDPNLRGLNYHYGNTGSSVRGTSDQILNEVRSVLGCQPTVIHVLMFWDSHDLQMHLEAFDTFEHALERFDRHYEEVLSLYNGDKTSFETYERDLENELLYFCDCDGYDVQYHAVQLNSSGIVEHAERVL